MSIVSLYQGVSISPGGSFNARHGVLELLRGVRGELSKNRSRVELHEWIRIHSYVVTVDTAVRGRFENWRPGEVGFEDELHLHVRFVEAKYGVVRPY